MSVVNNWEKRFWFWFYSHSDHLLNANSCYKIIYLSETNLSETTLRTTWRIEECLKIKKGSSWTNRRTRWSSIDEEKKVSLQRDRSVWKALAAKLRVTCSQVWINLTSVVLNIYSEHKSKNTEDIDENGFTFSIWSSNSLKSKDIGIWPSRHIISPVKNTATILFKSKLGHCWIPDL